MPKVVYGMRCPICNAVMASPYTRTNRKNEVKRRRVCPNGHIVTTTERITGIVKGAEELLRKSDDEEREDDRRRSRAA